MEDPTNKELESLIKHGIIYLDAFREFMFSNPSKPLDRGYYDSVRTKKKIGRNEPCSCGSGKKYKKCCNER